MNVVDILRIYYQLRKNKNEIVTIEQKWSF